MEREVAYHEAGHAVLGYLLYPPVSTCTIVPENGRLGNTISEIPFPFFGKFQYKYSAKDYFKIALYSWSGEYFQRIISAQIDEGGLVVDKELFAFYCNNDKLYEVFIEYKTEILKTFFASVDIHNMVTRIADCLLKQKTLIGSDIDLVLSEFSIDIENRIDEIVDKFHFQMCSTLVEKNNQP